MTQTLDEPTAEAVPPPALAVTQLSAGYGSTTVLRDVSMTVAAGSVTALLGPNGAGKTTLLRTVSGLLPVTSGSVRMHGEEISNLRSHKRFDRGLCHVPEGRGVFRHLTVRENVVMMSEKGKEREALERAAEAFPVLGERLDQRAGTLSGGEQQMLALAVAYIREPRVVLVDEASLGLAPIIVDRIFGFLESITARGAALLIVDQFVHRALRMASTAYILNRGRMTFEGTAASLLEANLFEEYLGRGTA